jgi:hypothetical protein
VIAIYNAGIVVGADGMRAFARLLAATEPQPEPEPEPKPDEPKPGE